PEHNDSKNENSEKTVEEVPVNPNEGTVEGTSNQETEKPVQPAEETQTNSGKIANENTGEVSNKPSDSKPPVEESNQPEKNGTATKPENSGNTTSENGQTEPEKKLELRNVSDIELYSQTNGTYRQHVSLDGIPENT
ncbi:hypothetical protein GM524_11475, partial [Streptococcus pneumoniae]